MRKILFLALLSFVLLQAAAGAWARTPRDQVRIYTSWDDYFIYFAFDVSDPDIQGVNRLPNTSVGDDDACFVYLHVGNDRPDAITPESFRMGVSVAGAAEFSQGTPDGQWELKPIKTFKYAYRLEGSINNDQDDDTRYQIEMAIPWTELGVQPSIGKILGFNAVVQMKGEHTGIISLNENTDEANRNKPSLWREVFLRGGVQPFVVRSEGRVLSNRALTRPPVIDGRIVAAEYNERNVVEIAKPPLTSARHIFRDVPLERLVLGIYHLDDLPTGMNAQGFALQPFYGIGPWTSSALPAWHRTQLQDAQRAGIDSVLVPLSEVTGGESLALQAVVSALRSLSADNVSYPLLTPLFRFPDGDFSRQALWERLKRFIDQTPPRYRVTLRLPHSRGAGAALPVFIETGDTVLSADDRAWLNEQLKRYAGAEVLVVASGSSAGEWADGILPALPTGSAMAVSKDSWLSVAVITPGYIRPGAVLSRKAGETYRNAWASLGQENPHWVVIDSINNWREGSAIGASAQFGYLYLDYSAIEVNRFNGMREWGAKFVYSSIPPYVNAQNLSLAQLGVRNSGSRPWRVGDNIRLAYRWYQGGRLYSPGLINIPIQRDVPIQGTAELSIGLIAADSDRAELPEGEWLIQFDLINSDGQLFSSTPGNYPLAVPIRVGSPSQPAYTILDFALPPSLTPGMEYRAGLQVRNDGDAAWPAGSGIEAVVVLAGLEGQEIRTVRAGLPSAVEPGRSVTIPVNINLPAAQSPPGTVVQTSVTLNRAGEPLAPSAAARFSTLVSGQQWFVDVVGPEKAPTGHTWGQTLKFPLDVRNIGTRDLPRRSRLVARWYSLDGKLLVAEGGKADLPTGLKPNQRIEIEAETYVPPFPGQYLVRWETQWNGNVAASGQSVYQQYVTVNGPALQFLNLEDIAVLPLGAFEEELTTQGFADGTGLSLDLIPPLLVPNPSPSRLFSSGLFGADPEGGPSFGGVSSWRWVSFQWPEKIVGKNTVVVPAGQSIPVDNIQARAVHLLAASVDGARQAEFRLSYGNAAETLTAEIGALGQPASPDTIAWRTPVRVSEAGVQGQEAYLYRVTLVADSTRPLTSIQLPDDPALRILAITLEKPAAAFQNR